MMTRRKVMIAVLALLMFCIALPAKRGEFLNSTGKDGRFHLTKDMYLCLSFSFEPEMDPREDAHLKAELLFNNKEGHDGLEGATACTPVTQKMIDRQNAILDELAKQKPMKYGESRTFKVPTGKQ